MLFCAEGLLSAPGISLKLWSHWSLREGMHRDCGIVRTEQGKTRCKKNLAPLWEMLFSCWFPFLSSLWLCDMNSMKSFFFSSSAFPYMIGSSLRVSFLHTMGEKYLLLISRVCFIVQLLWNLFSTWIFCASFLLVNAPKKGLVLILLHKEEIFVFQVIIQNLLQQLYVLLENVF